RATPEPSTTVRFWTSRSCGIARFLPWTRPRKPARRGPGRGAAALASVRVSYVTSGRAGETKIRARLRGVDSGQAAVVDGHLSAALMGHELVGGPVGG